MDPKILYSSLEKDFLNSIHKRTCEVKQDDLNKRDLLEKSLGNEKIIQFNSWVNNQRNTCMLKRFQTNWKGACFMTHVNGNKIEPFYKLHEIDNTTYDIMVSKLCRQNQS